ncbi:MAG: tryptophan synthase subunit alpha [Candidatus Melainabacteria bacterium GWF2_37_15]|nr:MAG: tryptophan synthase subunit alpha [Candidatus Melainabacteria bacterium GWF2_37_15]
MQNISRIQNSIQNSRNKPAFIPFVVAGFPDLETTKDLIKLFEQKGAAAVEIGFPHSDPLADGPVIQQAAKYSLENGINADKIFNTLEEIKAEISVPIILFTYFNPVFKYGIKRFLEKAAAVNAAGLIIPDLPLEESEEIKILCKKFNMDFIMLVSPASGTERIQNIARNSSGFIYLVSSTGVTGVRKDFSEKLTNIFREIKAVTTTPVAVGFGVSAPEHVQKLRTLGAEGFIIGSAIVKIIDKYKDNKMILLDNLHNYLKTMDISNG